jgi:hypothetical protein
LKALRNCQEVSRQVRCGKTWTAHTMAAREPIQQRRGVEL